jgi:hypothetical protein
MTTVQNSKLTLVSVRYAGKLYTALVYAQIDTQGKTILTDIQFYSLLQKWNLLGKQITFG